MFLTAAQAIAEQVSEDNLAAELIYPPRERIFNSSLHVPNGLLLASSTKVWRGASACRCRRADPIVASTDRSIRSENDLKR